MCVCLCLCWYLCAPALCSHVFTCLEIQAHASAHTKKQKAPPLKMSKNHTESTCVLVFQISFSVWDRKQKYNTREDVTGNARAIDTLQPGGDAADILPSNSRQIF